MTTTYLCRLLPPRPSFVQDMTETERQLMGAHAAYWSGLLSQGKAVVFGLVADPAGPWGVGVIEVADEAEIRALTANDPVIAASIGLAYEILPMPRVVARPYNGAAGV